MLELEDGNSYFRAVVNDAVKEILDGGVAYCFQQEQVNAIKEVLLNKHQIKDIFTNIVDGIFYMTMKDEVAEYGNGDIKETIEVFLEYMRGQNATDDTITNYRRNLLLFVNDCGITTNAEMLAVDRKYVVDYLQDLVNKKGLEVSSRNTRAIPIRRIFRYFKEEFKAQIDVDILFIKDIKPPIKKAVYLDDANAYRLIDDVKPLRSKAIISLFINTGIRVSELIKIKMEDIVRYVDDKGIAYYNIKIKGKGRKERLVSTNPETTQAIDKYIEKRRKKIIERTGTKETYLFLSNYGNQMARGHISEMIKTHCKRINCEDADKMSAHKLRHTYCTHMLDEEIETKDENGNIIRAKKHSTEEVRASMGHASLSTTSRYSHSQEEKVARMQREGW